MRRNGAFLGEKRGDVYLPNRKNELVPVAHPAVFPVPGRGPLARRPLLG